MKRFVFKIILTLIFHIGVYSILCFSHECKSSSHLAPILNTENSKYLPHRYIVHLKPPQPDLDGSRKYSHDGGIKTILDTQQTHKLWLMDELSTPDSSSKLEHSYDFDNFVGYSGIFDNSLLNKIRAHPAVELIERDQPVWIFDENFIFDIDQLSFVPMKSKMENSLRGMDSIQEMLNIAANSILRQSNIGFLRSSSSSSPLSSPLSPFKKPSVKNCSIQDDAPWGLSRISSPKLPEKFGKYIYPKSAGSDVDVYIIDTGININHADFEGRAKWGATIPEFDLDVDGNGHGTHCAGVVGSKTFGVAKNATLIAVKVLRTNGFGTNADVIKGIEWVLNQHRLMSKRGRKSVVNMSLGGGKSIALEKAVEITIDAGVHFAVAAGNDNANACNYSPAGSKKVICVGASTMTDEMAYFSNNGPCVDVFAPGLEITSTWIGSMNATNTISGTSMASPHVAGVMALYLSLNDTMSPKELKDLLKKNALEGTLNLIPPDTINKLLSTYSLLQSIST